MAMDGRADGSSRRWSRSRPSSAAAALLAATLLFALISGSHGDAAAPDLCLGTLPGASIPQPPGPPLRFGITPSAVAGQVGLPAAAKPENVAATLAALRQLAPPPVAFVLRLNRFFWSDGEPGIERFLALAHTYTAAGFAVELQLRYRPPAGHSGDIAGWLAFVRAVVRRFAPDPGVVGAQVTNEVNFTASPDSSDGANSGARDALIQGVIAAKQEARELGYDRFHVGFNWFYRTDPASEQSFWNYLGSHGGRRFADAVDWVGLDAYPGTFFPPVDTPGGERDAIANALSSLRCYTASAGIAARVPIYVEENGYPTGPARGDATQQRVLETMAQAVDDFRGAYNVSDYRWFNLRDADSSSPNFQQQFGLLRDDYSPKPAFASYRALVWRLGARSAAAPTSGAPSGRATAPRLALVVRGAGRARAGRCLFSPLLASLRGADASAVLRARFLLDGRPLPGASTDRRRQRIGGPTLSRGGRHEIAARVLLSAGQRVDLSAPIVVCRARHPLRPAARRSPRPATPRR
jgi:hypothetical protein